MSPLERRDFLRQLGAGLAGVACRAGGLDAAPPGRPDLEIELRAAPGTVRLRPGAPTRVWRYEGRVLHGPASAMQTVPGSYLGPLLRWQHGQKVRVHLVNDLPESTIVHWHGLDVPEQADGHPRLAVGPGGRYAYDFEIVNRAGTYWYHPHPHMRTALR